MAKEFHVLMIEDDPAHAEIIRRSLKCCTCANRITHISDGQAAVDYIFQQGTYLNDTTVQRPDVILLDLRLPRLDGLEVLQTVKQNKNLCSIPIIVLSTSAAEADVKKAYEYHANSFLTKPLDFQRFSEQLTLFCRYWLEMNCYP